MTKPARLGTIFPYAARLYDRNMKLIGCCLDTPNAIAKAAMEHREIKYAKSWGERHATPISQYKSRMAEWNEAKSHFEKL